MAEIVYTMKAAQSGVEPCAQCGTPMLTASPSALDEVQVMLYDRHGTSVYGTFTPKQLYDFAEAAAEVLVKQSEERARSHASQS